MDRRNFLMKTLLSFGGVFLLPKSISALFSKSLPMNKSIAKKSHLQFKQAFPGLKGVDIMAHAYPIEPFLVFTEFRMDRPVFGPHPHAGISVMTYMLSDSKEGFINRDSQGDFSFIEPGGMHIMQAGSGMHHDEFPKTTGNETHGFQIWINHSNQNRLVNPKSMHASAQEIPVKSTSDFTLRVVHGTFEDLSTPYQMVTAVNLYHIFLKPNSSIRLAALPMAFVYGLNGKGTSEGESIHGQTLVNFELLGNQVEISTNEEGLEFIFATGTPHNEPITYGGPFVMTTKEQMLETQKRYANGEMGILEPYSN